MPLATGDPRPEIAGETQLGSINLRGFQGTKHLVLWTYPKDATSG